MKIYRGYVYEANEEIFRKSTLDFIADSGKSDLITPRGSITLYHGTSKKNAESILKSGKFKGHPYFGLDVETSNRFAKSNHKGETVVLTLEVDPSSVLPSGGHYLTARMEGLTLHGWGSNNNVWHLPGTKDVFVESNNTLLEMPSRTSVGDDDSYYMKQAAKIESEFEEVDSQYSLGSEWSIWKASDNRNGALIIKEDDETVGYSKFSTFYPIPDSVWINMTYLVEEARGQSLMSKGYEYILNYFGGIVSDTQLSDESWVLYEKLSTKYRSGVFNYKTKEFSEMKFDSPEFNKLDEEGMVKGTSGDMLLVILADKNKFTGKVDTPRFVMENATQPSVEAYHATFAASLDSIRANGLRPGEGGGIGIGAYRTWSRGKIFFSTCENDISYWMDKYGRHAEDRSDDLLADSMIPILLRFQVENYAVDDVGQQEGRQCSFYTTDPIAPEDIEVYFNGEWTWLDETELELEKAIDSDGYLLPNVTSPH